LLEDLGRFLNTPKVVVAIRRQSGQDQSQARYRNDQQVVLHDILLIGSSFSGAGERPADDKII
jgi:hypothetical protein